jgi:UDP-N-acetylmuramate dehydrogenase
VELAPLTTLELGGAARHAVEVTDVRGVVEALRWAERQGLAVTVLGGGSNVVVADTGFDGLVVRVGLRGVGVAEEGGESLLTAAAGESWDRVVAYAVERDLAGVECLSGIPGTAGATPIQNVGAYGQEVGEVVDAVSVLDRRSHAVSELARDDCSFAYRTSRFRSEPDRYVVLGVRLRLSRGGAPTLRYDELVRECGARRGPPTLADVRETVLGLRRRKSMVVEPDDPNRRSVGSFFVNPVLDEPAWRELCERVLRRGAVTSSEEVPRYPGGDGRLKVPAAWLIERAGFARGQRRGPVGLSTRHALALVHHGGGTTDALLALAREIRDAVRDRFGVALRPEPVFVGFGGADPLGD